MANENKIKPLHISYREWKAADHAYVEDPTYRNQVLVENSWEDVIKGMAQEGVRSSDQLEERCNPNS